ncbi:MAG TPA: hypothetical protein VHE59_15360 [Mucilaginibacter sp.]|nr:hypothetical protein [Mucilaginibacter sp.]
MDYQEEENNYPKAFIATGIIVAVMAVLCYIIVFTNPPPPEMGTGGILVNYGTTDEGMGTDFTSVEEPSKAERPNHTKPSKVTPAPATEQKTRVDASDKKIVTQNTEDAPEVNTSKKATSKAVSTEKPTKPAKPTVNQNALYKGKANGATGEGDGTTQTPGNQGSPNGSTLVSNYGPGGSGNGGIGLGNRTWTNKPTVKDPHTVEGIVVVDLIVDADGNVTYAAAGRGTKMSDVDLIQKCVDAIKNSKVSPSSVHAPQEKGKYTFYFRVH